MKIPNIPDLSVIIPAYNSEKTIVACLTSLDCQKTGRQFETIVVDSSNDRTEAIVRSRFPHVTIMHFPDRKYCGDARNIGIACSKAPIIAFMDSDCTVDDDFVDQVVNAHMGANGVVGGVILNGASRTITGWTYYFCEFNLWLPADKSREIPEAAGCSLSMKRRVFDDYGPFVGGTYCSDTALHWRLWENGVKVSFVPSIKVYHTANHSVRSLLHHIFSHRYQYARLVVNTRRLSNRKRLALISLTPVLPLVLFCVVFLRVLRSGALLKEFFRSSPLVFAGLVARTLGELMGYSGVRKRDPSLP